jgi:hypothetical protein
MNGDLSLVPFPCVVGLVLLCGDPGVWRHVYALLNEPAQVGQGDGLCDSDVDCPFSHVRREGFEPPHLSLRTSSSGQTELTADVSYAEGEGIGPSGF